MKIQKVYNGLIDELDENQIFVFGSNPEGGHGGGAARVASEKFGAEWFKGRGLTGQCYALPTKNLKQGYHEVEAGITYSTEDEFSISTDQIKENIRELYQHARLNPGHDFLVAYTADLQLLCGYDWWEMAEMFARADEDIPPNIVFEDRFNVWVMAIKAAEGDEPV